MNLEDGIKDVIQNKLTDGTIEKLISEQLEKGVLKALESLMGSYGDVTKIIEQKVKSVMIPYLESYDYSDYLVKLDSVLVDVLKNSALENKRMLANFQKLMTVDEDKKVITVSDLFDIWTKHVAKNIETSDLKVEYDDGVSYESVEVTFNIEQDEDRSWSCFEYATLTFECEKDEKMNFAIRLSRYNKSKETGWKLRYDTTHDISSLRHLNEFEMYLMRLDQNRVKIEMDKSYGGDYITPEAEPEATFS